MTNREIGFFQKEIRLLYRNGILGIRSLGQSILGILCYHFSSHKNSNDVELLYANLYCNPAKTVVTLYRNGVLQRRFLQQCFLAWGKHKIRRNTLQQNPNDSPKPIFPTAFLQYYEKAFSMAKPISQELQATFFKTCEARLKYHFFFPRKNLDVPLPTECENWSERFFTLLEKTDLEMILQSDISDMAMHYFLRLKMQLPNCKTKPYFECNSDGIMRISVLQHIILEEKSLICEIRTIKCIDEKLQIYGYFPSQILSYFRIWDWNAVRLYAEDSLGQQNPLPLYDSSLSYFESYEKTAFFGFFRLQVPLIHQNQMKITCKIYGNIVPLKWKFSNTVPITKDGDFFLYNDYRISFNRSIFFIELLRASELRREQLHLMEKYPKNSTVTQKRKAVLNVQKQERIWLYSDYVSVQTDNGAFQFLHDVQKDDGIMRFYVTAREDLFDAGVIDAKYTAQVLQFGSEAHQIYFLAAEKIFAAFVDAPNCLNPFSDMDFPYYVDLFHAEIIYLQHGILQAHIPWKYSPVSEQFHADKLVISSKFEMEQLIQKYHFFPDQLLPMGMPRYDIIPKLRTYGKKILYAPSWRAFIEDVLNSTFWKKIMAFLRNPSLEHFLETYNLELDFKLHPMFEKYTKNIQQISPRIVLRNGWVSQEEYQIFLTDFSSYVFDFAYLKIPVIYFLPDATEFQTGAYQYRELDLAYADGFGNLFTQAEQVVTELYHIAENHFQPEEKFLSRMEQFFLPTENCRERLYAMCFTDGSISSVTNSEFME